MNHTTAENNGIQSQILIFLHGCSVQIHLYKQKNNTFSLTPKQVQQAKKDTPTITQALLEWC